MIKNVVVIFLLYSLQTQAFWWAEKEPKFTCKFDNLGGTFPDDACLIKEFFKTVKNISAQQSDIQKAWIIYGPPGTAKSKSARYIAEESKAYLLFHPVRLIVADSKGGKNITSEIAKIYQNAEEITDNKQPVLIVIDEVDVLEKDQARELFTSLRSQIDRVKDNSYIMTVITSNTIHPIDNGLLNRCTRVEWPVPSKNNRKEIIEFFSKKHSLGLSEEFVNKIEKKTYGFTGRDIENAFKLANMNAKKKCMKKIEDFLIEEAVDNIREQINKANNVERWGIFAKKVGDKALEFVIAVGEIASLIIILSGGKKKKDDDKKDPKTNPQPQPESNPQPQPKTDSKVSSSLNPSVNPS